MTRYLLPLGGFILLVLFLGMGLRLDPREVPSPLIDRPAPAFDLPQLHQPDRRFAPAQMHGKVWLLNVWASWCTACREEHPLLVELARTGTVPIYGLNYKDQPMEATGWLKQFGDPYALSFSDADGRIGIDYGVYGVPETFVIDRQGVIRYKQIGPVTPDALNNRILPLVKRLNG